jgi:histone H2B
MPPKAAAEKKPATKAPASKAPAEKKEAGKKTAASGDKKKRTKTRKETYSSYIYKGTTLPLWESRPFASIDRVNNVTSRSSLASNL